MTSYGLKKKHINTMTQVNILVLSTNIGLFGDISSSSQISESELTSSSARVSEKLSDDGIDDSIDCTSTWAAIVPSCFTREKQGKRTFRIYNKH